MEKFTRRRFAFWLGFGLFTLSEKLSVRGLDSAAAAVMRRGNWSSSRSRSNRRRTSVVTESVLEEHWIAADDENWQWFERENLVRGQWRLTGTTAPIHKTTGERRSLVDVYLDDSLVPEELLSGEKEGVVEVDVEESATDPELNQLQRPTAVIRHRQGKPPSEWLRSLEADEIRIWLDTIEVPNTSVRGMTHLTHLTRDHLFDPEKIEGLTEEEQAKLHSAAHFGY